MVSRFAHHFAEGKKKHRKKVTGKALIKPDLQLIGSIFRLLEEKQPTVIAFGKLGREINC